MKRALIPVITAVAALSACQSVSQDMTPARLAHTDDLTLTGLAADVAKALGRPLVEIGALDRENAAVIPVLPRRSGLYEGNNPMVPELFKVYEKGGNCWLLDEASGTFYPLQNHTCVSLNP